MSSVLFSCPTACPEGSMTHVYTISNIYFKVTSGDKADTRCLAHTPTLQSVYTWSLPSYIMKNGVGLVKSA